jgi:ubiquinone/menaquinone biosynthesis C-methylase UbiE
LPDLRLASDRYLDLPSERAKAEQLHEIEVQPGVDVLRLAAAYYARTSEVSDHRRDRFLRHIAGAQVRGEALASLLPKEGPVLEIGCGTGGLLVAAARLGLPVVGVDIASRWLVVARRRLSDQGLSVPLVAAEAERLPWPDATFHVVVADSVLEHLDDPFSALREWRRVLRPGGLFLTWSPNRFSLATDPHVGLWGVGWLPRRLVPSYLRLRDCANWAPRTHSAKEASQLAKRSGWEHIETAPPAIPQSWARSRPTAERLAIGMYDRMRRTAACRGLLQCVGPLWELRAEAPARVGGTA